jgi:hypothetical protein
MTRAEPRYVITITASAQGGRDEDDRGPQQRREREASAGRVDVKLEVVVIPVSDADRAKEFYGGLGWRLDADRAGGEGFRIIQFTPPGSECSVQFGTNMTSAAPVRPRTCT